VVKLLVLAGGFGTRLRPIVEQTPKALAPVADIPFLKYQIDDWLLQGVCDFVFLLHHQSNQIIDFLKMYQQGSPKKFKFDWVIESAPLGTGGAISNALQQINLGDNFLVANADTWLEGGVAKLYEVGRPSIVVVEQKSADRFGQVKFDNKLLVTSFSEKQSGNDSSWGKRGCCNAKPRALCVGEQKGLFT
jgi:D-glycero-alpha-D-manno-heptose 1-phosphate guanylyltransferase